MEISNGNRGELENQVVDLVVARMAELEHVVLGLVGGRSVQGIYRKLFQVEDTAPHPTTDGKLAPLTQCVDWSKVEVFMVDERCVPLNSDESNFKGIYESGLRELMESGLLPEKNVHPYDDEKSTVEDYWREFSEVGGHFDIVILSAGEDGHVASLFPGDADFGTGSIWRDGDGFISVEEAPKAPARRISASRTLLEKSDMGVLLFFGESKKEAFELFIDESFDVGTCPAKLIKKIPDAFIFSDL